MSTYIFYVCTWFIHIHIHLFLLIFEFTIDDCFDYLHEGVWELAIVENMSDFKTEIEVNIAEKGIMKWVRIGEGSAESGFMAPYGTRVGALMERVDGILDLTGDNEVEEQGSGNIVDDVSWRFDISVGTLIDGKDRQNTWYQACVMEIKHEEVQPAFFIPPPPTTDSKGDNKLKSIIKTTPLKIAKNVQINEPAEMKYVNEDSVKIENHLLSANQSDLVAEGTRSPTDEVRLRFEGVLTTTEKGDDTVSHSNGNGSNGNNIVGNSPIYFADLGTEVVDDDQMNVSVPDTIKTELKNEYEENIDRCKTNESDVVKKVKTVARVSFLGCAEFNDIWIDVDSDCLAEFNTKSEGKRGDIAIRETVIFLVTKKAQEFKVENDIDIDIGKSTFAAIKSEQEGFFHSPYYVDIINAFGHNRGFDSIFEFLNMQSQTVDGSMKSNVTEPVSTVLSLSIITAVGSTCGILTDMFLKHIEGRGCISSMVHSVRQMNSKELRETPLETVDAALLAIEALALACMGVHPSTGRIVESLLYDTAVKYLTCQYLIRRLNGLKMLHDLLKRAQRGALNPTGFETIKSTFMDNVTYKVVPLLLHHTVSSLCQQVADSGIISQIFKGDGAHESLMLRSKDILRTLIQEGYLNNHIIMAIWEAGFLQREAAAMVVLTEVISTMDIKSLSFTLKDCLAQAEASAVTSHMVDVLAAMANRCRQLVFNPAEPSARIQEILIMDLSTEVLHKLWLWCSDGSGVVDEVALKSLTKLEGALTLGVDFSEACAATLNPFPWIKQWLRCTNLVRLAVEDLKGVKNVSSSVSLLLAVINSWPFRENYETPSIVCSSSDADVQSGMIMPFPTPTRGDVATYLEGKYLIINTISKSIIGFKEQFDIIAKDIESECDGGVAPDALQNELNELLVKQSRVAYKEQLNRSLEFLYLFLRCSDALVLPQVVIGSLWDAIANHAVTTEEANLIVNFISRLILRHTHIPATTGSYPPTPPDSTICNVINSNKDSSITSSKKVKRKAVCTEEVYTNIFKHLCIFKYFYICIRIFIYICICL